MNIIVFSMFLVLGSVVVVFIAIVQHQRRIKKINKIKSQCESIVVLAKKIAKSNINVEVHNADIIQQYSKRYTRQSRVNIGRSASLRAAYLDVSSFSESNLPVVKGICYPELPCPTRKKRSELPAFQQEYLAVH